LQTPVLIIGSSFSGLATAACLRRGKVAFEVIEAASEVGAPWRRHYDRLHLHTNKRLSGLPYRGWSGAAPRYPSRLDVIGYLEDYRRAFDIRPHFLTEALSVRRSGTGWITDTGAARGADVDAERGAALSAETGVERVAGRIESRYVVMATGIFGRPRVIAIAGMESFPGTIVHSFEFKTGAAFTGRRVLIVGFGNSACEIAIDLVEKGAASVVMAVRSAVNVIPREVAGVPVLELSLLLRYLPPRLADRVSAPLVRAVVGDIGALGLRPKPYGPIEQIVREGKAPVLDIGVVRLIRDGKVRIFPGLSHIDGALVWFADGRSEVFDAIVAAVGYEGNVPGLVDVEPRRLDDLRVPVKRQRYFGADGLYFCGYWVSPTGQIREIGRDARRIAQDIVRREEGAPGKRGGAEQSG